MSEKVYVVPLEDLMVPDLDIGDFFPPKGRLVGRSIYIERRIQDGSLVVGLEPAAAPEASNSRARRSKRSSD